MNIPSIHQIAGHGHVWVRRSLCRKWIKDEEVDQAYLATIAAVIDPRSSETPRILTPSFVTGPKRSTKSLQIENPGAPTSSLAIHVVSSLTTRQREGMRILD